MGHGFGFGFGFARQQIATRFSGILDRVLTFNDNTTTTALTITIGGVPHVLTSRSK